MQNSGASYLKLSSSYLSADEEFDHYGKRVDLLQGHPSFADPSFRDFTVTAYAEYGLTHHLTLVGSLPFKSWPSSRTKLIGGGLLRIKEARFTEGLSDLTVGARFGLMARPVASSVQGAIKLPLGYDKTPDNDGAVLGTGEIDLEIQLLIGRSFYPRPLYATSGVGYRHRCGRLHDELFYAFETGYSTSRLLFRLGFDGLRDRTKPPDIYGQTVVTPLPGGSEVLPEILIGDQHMARLRPAIGYALRPHLFLQAEAFRTLSGTNSLGGTAYSLSLEQTGP